MKLRSKWKSIRKKMMLSFAGTTSDWYVTYNRTFYVSSIKTWKKVALIVSVLINMWWHTHGFFMVLVLLYSVSKQWFLRCLSELSNKVHLIPYNINKDMKTSILKYDIKSQSFYEFSYCFSIMYVINRGELKPWLKHNLKRSKRRKKWEGSRWPWHRKKK